MLQRLKQLFRKWFRRQPPPLVDPLDPYTGVREPRRRGPTRGSAVAVLEPEPPTSTNAISNR